MLKMVDAYPKVMVYCPNCGLAPEFCEYSGKFEQCKPWLAANFPHLHPQLAGAAAASGSKAGTTSAGTIDDLAGRVASVKLQDAGASAAVPPEGAADTAKPVKKEKSAKPAGPPKVYVELREQGKRRKITTVTGLEAYGVKLKEAASALGKKFGAGASVGKSATGIAQVDVQGDVAYDLPALLTSLFQVPEEAIRVDIKE